MHPVVVAMVLIAVASVFFMPRRYALAPALVSIFLTPAGEQLLVGGLHMHAVRIIIFATVIRVASGGISLRTGVFRGALTPLERTFFWWSLVHAVTYVLLWRETGAMIAQVAFCTDACGGYLLFRYFIQDESDVVRVTKMFSAIAAVFACCMLCEHLTRVNVFSYIKGATITPWIRNGRVRAQGVYSNSITAGTFGAVLMPLFFWLWHRGKARLYGAMGLAASTVIVYTSGASTPASAFLAAIVALCLWPIRKRMRSVRWGIVFAVLGFSLAMKAPVWYLIARMDFVGGHGWDRAFLIDQTVRNVGSWWLIGSKDNASWGADTWDACNQFVAEATAGGMITLVLFLTILRRGFGMIGKARKQAEGYRRQEWFFWCMGTALFAHLMAFFGIDYFDQTKILWFAFLAMISAATSAAPPKLVAFEEPEVDREFAAFMLAHTQNAADWSSVSRSEIWL